MAEINNNPALTPAGATQVVQVTLAPNDILVRKTTSNGFVYTGLSVDPLTPGTVSSIVVDMPVRAPCRIAAEFSLSQRVKGPFIAFDAFAESPDGPEAVFNVISIASITQAASVVTIVLGLPFTGFLSDWVNITGVTDTRLNYENLTVASISADRLTITATTSDESTIPSVTSGPWVGGTLSVYTNMAGASDGATFRFTGTNVSAAAIATLFNSSDVRISGILTGSHSVTTGTTQPLFNAAATGQAEVRAQSRFYIDMYPEYTMLGDAVTETTSSIVSRYRSSAARPSNARDFRARFRAVCPPAMAVPVGKVVSISKAGTTTCTVTTESPHSLVTGEYVNVHGVRDQTNFINTSVTQVTVLNATQFTCVIAGTGTATSYGGCVVRANGQQGMGGIPTAVIQSAAYNSVTSELTLTANVAWAGFTVTDHAQLYGLRVDGTGANLGVDGPWEVVHYSATVLTLKPLIDYTGVRKSPSPATFGTTNCGGIAAQRLLLRLHDVLVESHADRVRIVGQGIASPIEAIPTFVVATAPVTGTVAGTVAADSPIGAPLTVGARAANANPTAMSAGGDNVALLSTMLGALIVKPFSLPEADWSFSGVLATSSDVAAKAAAGAGLKNYVTGMQVQNTSATATVFYVKDGTTVKHQINLPASMTAPVDCTFQTPLASAANAIINVACATTGANVLANLQGYAAP